MSAARFLAGRLPSGGWLWAAIDANVHHVEPQLADTRFAAYLRPFTSDDAARQALVDIGCTAIEVEDRRGSRRGPLR